MRLDLVPNVAVQRAILSKKAASMPMPSAQAILSIRSIQPDKTRLEVQLIGVLYARLFRSDVETLRVIAWFFRRQTTGLRVMKALGAMKKHSQDLMVKRKLSSVRPIENHACRRERWRI
jgi:hypothetical protein